VGVVSVDDAGTFFHTEAIEFFNGVSTTTVTGGGISNTHAVLEPARFTKVIDHISIELLKLIGTGKSVTIKVQLCSSVQITPTPACNGAPSATYEYDHALLTKVETTSSLLFTNTLEENVVFEYQKVTVTIGTSSVSLS